MFRLFSKSLTEYSHHYIDWSRIGNLIASNKHRYSKEELVTRGGIIGCIAGFAFLAAYFNEEEKSKCSTLTASMLGGLFGFVTSHAVVIYPLIKKRCDASKVCQKNLKEIEMKVLKSDLDFDAIRNIKDLLDHIEHLSLSNSEHGNASMTWGRKKNLLLRLNSELDNRESSYWLNAREKILADLEENNNQTKHKGFAPG